MGEDPPIPAIIAELQGRLDAVADPATKAWFENYLKQAIGYRGVKTPVVARIVAGWRVEQGLDRLSDEDQLRRGQVAGRGEPGRGQVRRDPVHAEVPGAADGAGADCWRWPKELFAGGAFFDWSTSDWFSVRVLGPLLRRGGMEVAERIAEWRVAGDLWQRRAAIVPFRAVVRDEAYHPLIEETIGALVGERERFIQTGIGWVVSDMSKAHPEVAAALVERHFDDLSAEVVRRHTRYLPGHEVYKERKRGQSSRGVPIEHAAVP